MAATFTTRQVAAPDNNLASLWNLVIIVGVVGYPVKVSQHVWVVSPVFGISPSNAVCPAVIGQVVTNLVYTLGTVNTIIIKRFTEILV